MIFSRLKSQLWIVISVLVNHASLLKVPNHCTNSGPVNLIEQAIPKIGRLPDGVSVVYDAKSHVHALQFLPETTDIQFPTSSIFKSCQYFPEEFSIFFILSHGKHYRRDSECIFSINGKVKGHTLVAICLTKRKIIFIFDSKKTEFRNTVFKDNKWHTVGFSVTGSHVLLTIDCLVLRKRKLRRKFPSFLEVESSYISLAREREGKPVLQGWLKDIILVPGADVARRACPPRMPRSALLDNHIPSMPEQQQQQQHMSSYDTVGPDWEGCRWMDVGNLAFDVYSDSVKVCVNGIWKQVSTHYKNEKRKNRQLDYFDVYQDVLTPSASIDIELFHIPGEGLFAMFANSDKPGRKGRSVSGLYKWTEKMFRPYQRLPSVSAQSWRFFSIEANFFLAVANYGNNSNIPTNSTIFKWHRHRKKFREFQTFVTYTARDMEYFMIGEEHFLAVANHEKDSNQEVDSVVMKWNRKSRRFETFQSIVTVGAYDWTYFRVREYHFLAIAQAFNGRTTLMESMIYVYQNDRFLRFQTLETNGATDLEFFTINGDAYLAIANAYNYGPQNFRDIDTFQTNSSIYKLDFTKRAFLRYQTFVTNSAIDWEYFTIGKDQYLIVSNAQNGGAENQQLTIVYRLQGVDKFVPVHRMYLEPSADWETFQDGDDFYLIYSNAKGRQSQVLKAKLK